MIYHNVFQFKYWENEDLLKLDVRVYLFLFVISVHWVVIKVFILVSMNPVEYWYLYHIKYQEISFTELMIKYNTNVFSPSTLSSPSGTANMNWFLGITEYSFVLGGNA